jgi:hypothetical protein
MGPIQSRELPAPVSPQLDSNLFSATCCCLRSWLGGQAHGQAGPRAGEEQTVPPAYPCLRPKAYVSPIP